VGALSPARPCSGRSVHTTGFVALDLLVVDGLASAHAGGSAANIAINLGVLGWDARVSGLLGDDDAGRTVVRDLQSMGVDTSGLQLVPEARTPVVVHEVREGRHRFRFSCPNCGTAYAKHRPLPPERAAAAGSCDAFVFDRTTAYALAAAELARRDGSIVMFEPGTPGRPAAFRHAVQLAHLFRRSHDLDERVADRLPASPPGLEVVGHGAAGVRWRGTWGTESFPDWRAAPAETAAAVTVVDPGGAGDWLSAVLLDRLLASAPVPSAIADGQRLAALCCGFAGTRGLLACPEGRVQFERAIGRHPVAPPAAAQVMAVGSGQCSDWFCALAAA
jgi:fructokinase